MVGRLWWLDKFFRTNAPTKGPPRMPGRALSFKHCVRSGALAGRDLVVLAVLAPLVEHVVDRGDVALLVVADRAEHRVPLVALDGLGDLLGVGGLGLGHGLRPDLQ